MFSANTAKNEGVCFVCLFSGFNVLWFVFFVFGKVVKVSNMLVFFSQLIGLLWGGLFLFIWVWKV